MTSTWQVLLVAAGTTLLSLPIVRATLLRHGVMDHASERSSHTSAVPRGGGLGVLAGVGAGTAVAMGTALLTPDVRVLAVGLAVGLLALTGFRDDVRSLGALSRLVVQGAAGTVLGLAVSTGAGALVMFGAAVAGVLLMVLVVNVVNFMDGINGITALTMISWGAVILWAASDAGVSLGVTAGAVAVGTGMAFLPFNAPRAVLFLGDAGSYFYGALVASVSMVLIAAGIPPLVVAAPLVPYVADVLATLLRRARRGVKLSAPHREHLYQLLTSSGGRSHLAVSVAYAALALACGAVAILAPSPAALVALAVAALGVAAGPRLPTVCATPSRSRDRVAP